MESRNWLPYTLRHALWPSPYMPARLQEGRVRTWLVFRSAFLFSLIITMIEMPVHLTRYTLVPHLKLLYPLVDLLGNPSNSLGALMMCALLLAVALFSGQCDSCTCYLVLATSLGSVYFMSVFDCVQHHYLFVLLLLLIAMDEEEARHLRVHELVFLMCSIVYGWACVTKLTSPHFRSGHFFLVSVYNGPVPDRVLGVVAAAAGGGHWAHRLIVSLSALSAWAVIAIEGFLSLSLLVSPFGWLNVAMIFALHGLIGLLELSDPLMRTDMFSVMMLGVGVLCVPPAQARHFATAVLPRTWLHKRFPRDWHLGTGWHKEALGARVLLVLFLMLQMMVPLRCYPATGAAWATRDLTDERFCWRMFSDESLRDCTLEWTYRNTNTYLEMRKLPSGNWTMPDTELETLGNMNRAVCPMMAHRICQRQKALHNHNRGTGRLRYTAYCDMYIAEPSRVYIARNATLSC